MLTPAEVLVPGLAQWRADRRLEGVLFGGLFAGFALAAAAGPALLPDADNRYELMWNILAFSPTRGQLALAVGIGMALLTWMLSLVDHHTHVPGPYEPVDRDRALWRLTQELWLRGDTPGALAALDDQAQRCRRDPMWHYLRARLCLDLDRTDEARRGLADCRRTDITCRLGPERDRLERQLQGDAP